MRPGQRLAPDHRSFEPEDRAPRPGEPHRRSRSPAVTASARWSRASSFIPTGIFYKKLEPKDVPAIIDQTVLQGQGHPRPRPTKTRPPGRDIRARRTSPSTASRCGFSPKTISRSIPSGSRITSPWTATQALAKALFDMTVRRRHRRGQGRPGCGGAAGPGFPTGKKWQICREAHGPSQVHHLQRRRRRPGRLHGPEPPRGQSPQRHRRHDHRRLRHRRRRGLHLRPDGISARRQARHPRPRAGAEARPARPNILGSEFHFDIHIVQGAGAFVSGEETSLMASIEGRRAFPRQRPPFPGPGRTVGKADQHQQRRDLGERARSSSTKAPDGSPRSGRKKAKGRRSSPSSGRSTTPGSSRSRWASPCARSSTISAAASRTARRSRPSRPAVPPAAASRPASSTCPSTMIRSPRPGRSWARAA